MAARLGKGFRIRDGKVVKSTTRLAVSERIRQRKSKRQKVARKGDVRGA